jgi:ribosome-interacting GTPase 1
MPANLPPAYFAAEKEYRNSKTTPEKIAALEEMLAAMPHHKGTDKLRAGLTRKIAQLKEQEERQTKSKRGSVFSVDKQGAAQVILLGFPNVGKSTLLSALTHAHPEIANYPYTTAMPVIGMMEYEDIQIQMVDLPPLGDDIRKLPFYNLIRNADLLLLVIDSSGDPAVELGLLLEELEDGKVFSVLKSDEELPVGGVVKRMLVILNKCDGGGEEAVPEGLKSYAEGGMRCVTVSATKGKGLERMRLALYEAAEIIRVYTKIPHHKPDMDDPFVLTVGSTVMDLAREIHHDFSENLQFARVWGSSRFEGQSVQRDFVLQDGDVVELHI